MLEILIILGIVYFAYKLGVINFIYDKVKNILLIFFKSSKWLKVNYSEYEKGKMEIARFNKLRRREHKINNEF